MSCVSEDFICFRGSACAVSSIISNDLIIISIMTRIHNKEGRESTV